MQTTMIEHLDWADLEDFRVETTNIQRHKLLGKGGFGQVWLGTYNGDNVAIKLLTDTPMKTVHEVQKFINEVILMTRLKNPYIVSFLGCVWAKLPDIELIVEYMNEGDLKEYLNETTPSTFSWPQKIQCAIDILHGLMYLHSNKIIHRDLKSRNILLDSAKPTKLTDFGVSREVHSKTMTQEVGTYRWAAPEILNGGRFRVSADIYSFGMLLIEFDTHEVPYHDLRNADGEPLLEVAIMMKVLQGDITPQVTPRCPPFIEQLIREYTRFNPDQRPTAGQVLQKLQDIQLAMNSTTGGWCSKKLHHYLSQSPMEFGCFSVQPRKMFKLGKGNLVTKIPLACV
ncbi:hypothetical protein LEN26_007544 [Aphanomyces euteiches]|nr:hypothetical protein LEN26_007544 [Aphanomyces euteiches]